MEGNEVKALLDRWTAKTVDVLMDEIGRLDVEDTKELKQSLAYSVRMEGDAMLRAQIYFNTHGRFVDMGVGRGQKIEDVSAARKKKNARKPRKWYSPAFYGRLSSLRGAVGIELMETAMETLKNGILDGNGFSR